MSTQDLSVVTQQNQPFTEFPQNRAEIEKNGPERADFDSRGKFAPGNCANPGGRPKTRHITDAYKAILERDGAETYAEVVANDALLASKASDRLAAVQEMTDRVEGKATQRMDVRGLICMMPAEGVMSTLDDWAGDDE